MNSKVGQSSLIVNNSTTIVQNDNTNNIQSDIENHPAMVDQPNKFDRISDFIITKRHLPHWQIPGSVYFITFRTKGFELSEIAKDIISRTILFHDKKKYQLFTFVIMPDHIHIILKPLAIKTNEYFSLSEITHSIKSYSANEINKVEKQKGRIVWQHESFDRIIRDDNELYEKMNYILNNPVKCILIDNGYEYKWYYLSDKSDTNQIQSHIVSQSGMIDLPY